MQLLLEVQIASSEGPRRCEFLEFRGNLETAVWLSLKQKRYGNKRLISRCPVIGRGQDNGESCGGVDREEDGER